MYALVSREYHDFLLSTPKHPYNMGFKHKMDFNMQLKALITLLTIAFFAPKTFADNTNQYHSPHTTSPYHFKMNIVDANASGTYGLIGHDINQDGYTDLVSFAYSGTTTGQPEGEIYWYEFLGIHPETDEPRWKKHFLTKKKHVVHGAFMDVDNDHFPDLIFMSNFEVPIKDEAKEGDIWWAKRPRDLNAPEWETFWIGRSPGAHRIATVDLDGNGSRAVVVIPIFSKGKPPLYGTAAITLFTPGKNPELPWNKKVFNQQQFHAIHDAVVASQTKDHKGESLLIAAQEGIWKITFYKNKIGEWNINADPLHASPSALISNTRDKGIQVLGFKNPAFNVGGVTSLPEIQQKTPFIAAIDYDNQSGFLQDQPWHGDTVSVYIPKEGDYLFAKNNLQRQILEKRSAGGHAVQLIDFTGNGCPDVLAGFRAYPTGLIIYHCKKEFYSSYHFEKQIISERSANSIVIGHWDNSGTPGFATAGFGAEGDPYIVLWRKDKKG